MSLPACNLPVSPLNSLAGERRLPPQMCLDSSAVSMRLCDGHCLLLAASAAYLQEENFLPTCVLTVSCGMLDSLLSRLHCQDATVYSPDLHQGCSTQMALDSLRAPTVPCNLQDRTLKKFTMAGLPTAVCHALTCLYVSAMLAQAILRATCLEPAGTTCCKVMLCHDL